MCGIVGYIGEGEAAPILLDGLSKLEYRGYDSAGIAVLDDNIIAVSKTSGRIANLCRMTSDGKSCHGHVGIGHTRWATHGAPTDLNAHPHMSNDGRFAVVHNGIIENYMQLKSELTALGFEFSSETDTEVIAHLLQLYYEGDLKAAFLRTLSRLRGSYAVGVLCTQYPDVVYVAREASPLIIGVGKGENYFASDVTALIAHTRDIIYLDEGEIACVTSDTVDVFDMSGHKRDKKISHVSWDISAAEKGGYEHFMLKEIMEQPRAVRATLSPRIKESGIVLDDFELDAGYLRNISKIVITACGSAYYAGVAGKYAIEKLCRIPVSVELASELRYGDPIIDKNTLLIVLSQSGETADTIAAMKECKSRGAKTIAVVNVVGSTVSKLADHTLYTWAGPEIAVATTKGYTTQLAVLYMLSLYIAEKLDTIERARYDELLESLKSLPEKIESALRMNESIAQLSQKYCTCASMFFIGRNTDYAVALEGALKLKEISYIHAECYAAGELKHGTIALVDEDKPVVALMCNDSITEKTVSNVVEVKARGARVLALAHKDNEKAAQIADDIIFAPSLDPVFSPIAEMIPLQLFAYHVARSRGCDIDRPRNLAKSVTVE